MSNPEVLAMLSHSQEFEQVKVRASYFSLIVIFRYTSYFVLIAFAFDHPSWCMGTYNVPMLVSIHIYIGE